MLRNTLVAPLRTRQLDARSLNAVLLKAVLLNALLLEARQRCWTRSRGGGGPAPSQ